MLQDVVDSPYERLELVHGDTDHTQLCLYFALILECTPTAHVHPCHALQQPSVLHDSERAVQTPGFEFDKMQDTAQLRARELELRVSLAGGAEAFAGGDEVGAPLFLLERGCCEPFLEADAIAAADNEAKVC